MINLYPSIGKILIAFQLLHIWFKGKAYFSWWLIIPTIILYIIAETIVNEIGIKIKQYFKNNKYK